MTEHPAAEHPSPVTPQTEAGRKTDSWLEDRIPDNSLDSMHVPELRRAILAIEREAADAARKEVEPLARWIVSHHVGSVDHACRECVPYGDVVIEGFRCAFHESRAILDSLARPVEEEK